MSILQEVFDRVTPTPIVYVRLKKNEIELKHIQSGKSLSRKSTKVFSNERLLVADFEIAEEFLKDLCDELLDQKNKMIKKSIGIVLQPIDDIINVVTPVERRVYNDFAHFGGGKHVWIIDHQTLLSDDEVLAIVNKKN